MTKNIPYKWYKFTLLVVWALAILCIAATWVGFCVGGAGALAFGAIVDSFLTLALVLLIVLLFMNGREDYKKRAYIFGGFAIAHLVFFILVLAFSKQMQENFTSGYYALPVIHMLLLIGISVVGIYFWIRNKFTFKSAEQEDAHAAFGGPVEQEKKIPEEPVQKEEPTPARDEKTGIVSL